MKFKPAWIGLFLIAVMLLSTFAYAIMQSLGPSQMAELPESNIISYALEPSIKNYLIQSGSTIITFEYNLGCNNCIDQKSALEFLANEYKQQILLEELVDESLGVSKITIASAYGEQNIVDANETQIVASLCNLMIYPPATCVFQKT